jgi:hypothetical protein
MEYSREISDEADMVDVERLCMKPLKKSTLKRRGNEPLYGLEKDIQSAVTIVNPDTFPPDPRQREQSESINSNELINYLRQRLDLHPLSTEPQPNESVQEDIDFSQVNHSILILQNQLEQAAFALRPMQPDNSQIPVTEQNIRESPAL